VLTQTGGDKKAMAKAPSQVPQKKVESIDFRVDLKISDTAEVFVFHALPFEKKLSWLEFDLDTGNLDFVMNDGDVRNFGAKVPENLAKHMHNAYQVMMVQMDQETGQPVSGAYFPLIIHRA
jgi:hypothetical protein